MGNVCYRGGVCVCSIPRQERYFLRGPYLMKGLSVRIFFTALGTGPVFPRFPNAGSDWSIAPWASPVGS